MSNTLTELDIAVNRGTCFYSHSAVYPRIVKWLCVQHRFAGQQALLAAKQGSN